MTQQQRADVKHQKSVEQRKCATFNQIEKLLNVVGNATSISGAYRTTVKLGITLKESMNSVTAKIPFVTDNRLRLYTLER